MSDITYQQHLKNMEELRPYLDLMEGADEFEQTIQCLAEFNNIAHTSDEFQQAYFKEVQGQLEWIKENVTIEETKEEIVTTIKSRRYLEYNQ